VGAWLSALSPLFASAHLLQHPSSPLLPVYPYLPARNSMSKLKGTIDGLKILSNVFGTVPAPFVSGSLKSAAELAAKTCELVQVRQNNIVLPNTI
jgi:hypothetical protein